MNKCFVSVCVRERARERGRDDIKMMLPDLVVNQTEWRASNGSALLRVQSRLHDRHNI